MILVVLAAGLAAPGRAAGAPAAAEHAATVAPLEPCTAAFPAPLAGDLTPQTLGLVAEGRTDGHFRAQGKGYVHAPLSAVWAALHDPSVSQLRIQRVQGRLLPAPGGSQPLRFRFAYRVHVLFADVRWEVAYAGGPLAGSIDHLDAPGAAIGVRWDKSAGTAHIRVLSGSLVAREVAPEVTAIELVAWLDADRAGQREATELVGDWFSHLVDRVHAPAIARAGAPAGAGR